MNSRVRLTTTTSCPSFTVANMPNDWQHTTWGNYTCHTYSHDYEGPKKTAGKVKSIIETAAIGAKLENVCITELDVRKEGELC